jgi:transposase
LVAVAQTGGVVRGGEDDPVMAQNFLACDREQSFLLPPDVREWLPEDHLAWFVIDAVGVMDTSRFYGAYREDGHGRAAYEPSMMIALLLYCWACGTRSSRAIERASVGDVACRVIAAHQRPDHATIARFVVRHERALGGLFGEVLGLCADAGLATVGVIAIDGTKVNANANRDRTMSYQQIAQAIVEEAIQTDAAETEALGDARGDELPETVATAEGRQRWLRAARQRLDQQRAHEARPIRRSRAAQLTEAKRRLEQELAVERDANERYEAYRARGVMKNGRRFGSPPKPYSPPAIPDGKINVTDPDSKLVKGMRGWVQGYNAQAACNEQHLILAAEVMTASPDFGHLGPMLTAARRELGAAGVTEPPEVVLADAGYWHLEQMNEITGDGIPVLIPPDSSRRKNTNTRPGWNGGAYDFMRSVLSTDRGSELYKQRAQLIEPIFGNTKHNRGFNRFARRGRSAARTEWRMIATTHNLLKLHQHFTATVT